MPALKFSAATDQGLLRSNNEDSYLGDPDHNLWLVADGMGGHEAGEVASAIGAETIQRSTLAGKALPESIRRAHQAILEAAADGVGARGMGSTVVALVSDELEYQVAWVGDSRAYLWTADNFGGTLEQLSTDHSYVQELLASGAIAEHEAVSHPDKNVITQCLGSLDADKLEVDSVKRHWQENQWILLCSDGLTDELSNDTIAQVLRAAGSLREAVSALVQQALSRGGRDNVTVLIVESPLAQASRFDSWRGWLSKIPGKRRRDGVTIAITLVSLGLLSCWILLK